MRILFVNHEYPPVGGGGAYATQYLVRELARRGHDIDVLTSRCFGLAKKETADGATIYRVPVRRRRVDFSSVPEMGTFVATAVPKALLLASKRKYDLVHTVFGVPSGPIGWVLKRTHRVPYIIRMGGGDIPGFKPYGYDKHYRRVRRIVTRLWDDAAGLIVVSEDLKRRVSEVHPDGNLPVVIPNGVDAKQFHPPHKNPEKDLVRIMTVSRLIDRKRIDILLSAVLRLSNMTQKPFHVDIVGDGIERKNLESFVKKHNLSGIVSFRGSVSHDDLPSVLREADIFVLTSLAEGMPNALLEALASGLPLITTDTGGASELIIPNQNGYIVPKENVQLLVDRLRLLVEHDEMRKQFGARSRTHAETFSWSSIAARVEAMYKRIVKIPVSAREK